MSNTKPIIKKNKVITSSLFIPLAIPFFAFCTAFTGLITEFEGFFMTFLGITFLGLLFGSIYWIPSMIFCMMIETVFINKKSTKKTVMILLIIEAIIACSILYTLMDFGIGEGILIALIISISATQVFRWIHLNRKNRMFEEDAVHDEDETLIDDIEI